MHTEAQQFLGKTVTVTMDRPLGSLHPKHGYVYPVNYGFVPETTSPDGEELDAYVLGVDIPLKEFTGRCIAFIHRLNDDDDKLIVVPEGTILSDDEIRQATHFQEQYFISEIVRAIKIHNKLYRYTANGEGVWSAGKRLLPDELVDEALEQRKWMPKPQLPEGEYTFFLTEKGKERYENTLFNTHKKYLSNIQLEEIDPTKIGEVVYEDDWQVVAKVHTIGFAKQLVSRVKEGTKTLTYRLGRKYDFLKVGDRLKAEDSSKHLPFAEIEIMSTTKTSFIDLPIDRQGHEVYASKAEQRKIFEGFYGRSVSDQDDVMIIEFKVVRLLDLIV